MQDKFKEEEIISEMATAYILTRQDKELKKLKPGDVAAAIGIGNRELSRIFKKSQKISLCRFILREILYRAVFILERNRYISTARLSSQLGYKNADNFTKDFESFYLVNPEKYKEMIKKRQ